MEQIDKKPTKNLKAYNLYLKGRFFWHRRTEEDLNKSIKYFNQAIELDSTYALAYSGLADSYYILPFYTIVKDEDSVFNLSKKYAEKSLSIDKNNAEAHATLGGILCYKDWHWEASETEFKLATSLNPNYATGHQFYAELLRILGRAKEAREQIDLAINLNPNSIVMLRISAYLYYEEGLFEKAIIEANKVKEFNKDIVSPYWLNMSSYTYWGKDDEAMAEWEESLKLHPTQDKEELDFIKGARDAFEKAGMKGFYKSLIDVWLKNGNAYKIPVSVAQGFAYFGEKEKALEWLELAYKQRSDGLIIIKHEYDFINLRSEPRFLAILEKMNLGDYE